MKSKKWRSNHCRDTSTPSLLSVLFILVLAACLVGWFAGTTRAADLQGTGWTVQGQGGSETAQPAGQTQPVTAGQAQDQTEQLGDVEEKQPSFLDPDSIPESAPEGDWVFEVPVQVSDISPEVEKLGLVCEVFTGDQYMEEIHGENNWKNKVVYGRAKKRIDLQNGNFQGTILIGVNRTGKYWKATHYTCWLYLIGPDNNWHVPTIKPRNPQFRRMHSGHAFQWETQGVPLPQWARFASPEDSGN